MDYYERFIMYSLKTCASRSELANRNSRQKHNRAMTSLYKLMRGKMYAEPNRCAEAALRLMAHSDARVRMHAAAYCLQAEVHQERARALLYQMSREAPEGLIQFNAKMSAMCCIPFSKQPDPS